MFNEFNWSALPERPQPNQRPVGTAFYTSAVVGHGTFPGRGTGTLVPRSAIAG